MRNRLNEIGHNRLNTLFYHLPHPDSIKWRLVTFPVSGMCFAGAGSVANAGTGLGGRRFERRSGYL